MNEKITEKSEEEHVIDETYVSPNQWLLVMRRIANNNVAMIAFYFIMLNVLITIFYPVLISYSPTSIFPGGDIRAGGGSFSYPNLKYPGGTDRLSYDGFSRLLAGSETSILVGIFATIISLAIGVIIGLLAGYYQGWVEEVFMRLADLFLSVPFLVIALIILRIVNSDAVVLLENISHVAIITILIGIFGWAGLSRLVTANVKQVSSMEYIQAIRVMGAKDRRIIFVHILPNVLPPITVIGALAIAGAMLSEAGLAFLGFADATETISWGIQVNLARSVFTIYPEQVLISGFAIFFLVLAVNIFGDALRDALDPRLKQ